MSSTETNESPVTRSSFDQVLDALSDARRRIILQHLADADRPVALADVATAVAGRERTDGDGTDDRTTAKQVAVMLHHVHLPKLEEVRLVEQTSTEITLTPTGERVYRSLLDGQDQFSDNGTTGDE